MIDCENEVYSRAATVLREKFPGIDVSSEYVKAPSTFPHVSIVQSNNTDISRRMTMCDEMAQVMFEINVYSNKTGGKKTECKTIVKAVDDIFHSMNFRRIALTPMPNLEDATIYRMVVRYRAATDGKFFYRR